ncbi:hypothetical protein ACIGXM_29925 [Kitasatospora sp. NPDC052896]|uniref:hypothetical protein n=1 Tax=Kitasatospora sp. NPDC052896 TaxID=3364061 RepID=UPI0037C52A51
MAVLLGEATWDHTARLGRALTALADARAAGESLELDLGSLTHLTQPWQTVIVTAMRVQRERGAVLRIRAASPHAKATLSQLGLDRFVEYADAVLRTEEPQRGAGQPQARAASVPSVSASAGSLAGVNVDGT